MHRSRPFDALGWEFRVASPDACFVEYVEHLYVGLATATGADVHEYVVGDVAGSSVVLTLADETLARGDDTAQLVLGVVHDVNRRAIAANPLLAAHAGGVARGDRAVVLPASMESGKTTLTTGLVRAGFDYASDEAVAFDWDTLEIVPYAKPLSLDPGSWPLFPELEPVACFGGDGYKAAQWQVPAQDVRPQPWAIGTRARYLVFPDYDASARTELLAISRGEALVELARNTFRFRAHGRRALATLASVVEGADCYRLPVGDLGEAVERIEELVA